MTNSVSSLWVWHDTVLSDQYLLKKDSIVQIPGALMHADATLWGSDVKEFNPRRFLKGTTKYRPGAFRTFGGETRFCPGRHFATMETMSTVTIFVTRYEMGPKGGVWKEPKLDTHDVLNSVTRPTSRLDVIVSTRKGFEDDEWGFGFGALTRGFEVY